MIWVFLGILIMTLVINELLYSFSASNLSYSTKPDKKVYEIGEEITMMPIIENRKIVSVPFLRVDEYYDKSLSVEVLSLIHI